VRPHACCRVSWGIVLAPGQYAGLAEVPWPRTLELIRGPRHRGRTWGLGRGGGHLFLRRHLGQAGLCACRWENVTGQNGGQTY